MPKLPTPGESTDTWGRELNAWLLYDHNADGTHKRLERKPKEEAMSDRRQVDVKLSIEGRRVSVQILAMPERLRGAGAAILRHSGVKIGSIGAFPHISGNSLWLRAENRSADHRLCHYDYPNAKIAGGMASAFLVAIDALNDKLDAEDGLREEEKAKNCERCRNWRKGGLDKLEGRCETLLKMVREQAAEIEALRNG